MVTMVPLLIWIPPILMVVAVCLVIWPTKKDPAFPDRKVRDWWAIGWLLVSAMVVYRVGAWVFNNILSFFPVGRVLQMTGVAEAGTNGVEKAMYTCVLVVLVWQAWREAVTVPRETNQPILWREVGGCLVFAAVVYVFAYGWPGGNTDDNGDEEEWEEEDG